MSRNQRELRLPIKRNDAETLRERMTENAHDQILPARYLRKDADGNIVETQEELFERVAANVAVAEAVHTDDTVIITPGHIKPDHPRRDELIEEVFFQPATPTRNDADPDTLAEEVELTEENAKYVAYDVLIDTVSPDTRKALESWKGRFHELMAHLDFTPNTPTLINAGDDLQQLSACFVNSPDDDMNSIHETAREAALTFQTGGGNGYDFSRLRPYGDVVGSTGGIASGPITFMETFDQVCRTIAQGGVRRGAQMGVMRVDHPDVIHFIHAKNKDVSLAHVLQLGSSKDYKNSTFNEALEEARGLIEDEQVPEHLRNAAEGFLANFNISVAVTDEFMAALDAGEDFDIVNPRTDEQHVATAETKEMYGWFDLADHVEVGEPLSIPAEALWERMIDGAWENGEPGVIFLDRVNALHSFDSNIHPEHKIRATNPCSEQPLEEYEACNLGHINLSTIARMDAPDWREYANEHGPAVNESQHRELVSDFLLDAVDMDELDRRTEIGTRFLDNVVTMSDFPISEIEQKVRHMRKIGLGIMGLAQLYIQLGVEYGSTTGNLIAEELMMHINHESKRVSHDLADERGVFGEWGKSKYAHPKDYPHWFVHHVGEQPGDYSDGYEIRNHNTTTIAPTGTTSMLADTSGGCEPIYNVAYYKNISNDVQGDEMLVEFDSYFLRCLEANGIDVDEAKAEAAAQMANNEFDGVIGLESVPNALAELFVTAGDITGKEHAAVLCACQKGVDSGISKTCNMPASATREDVREVYEYIYENGGKCTTVYRDGSRATQVLTTRADNQGSADDEGEATETPPARPRARSDVTVGETRRIETGYGKMYVSINEDEHGLFEVFANIGKSGGFTQSMTEGMARLISLALRSGVPVEDVIDQLDGIRSPRTAWDNAETVESVPDGIAVALKRHTGLDQRDEIMQALTEGRDNTPTEPAVEADGGDDVEAIIAQGDNPECPECATMLMMTEGCKTCPSCGWSQCG